jgi:hypothetical protein
VSDLRRWVTGLDVAIGRSGVIGHNVVIGSGVICRDVVVGRIAGSPNVALGGAWGLAGTPLGVAACAIERGRTTDAAGVLRAKIRCFGRGDAKGSRNNNMDETCKGRTL